MRKRAGVSREPAREPDSTPAPSVRRPLPVGRRDDPLEHEADRVAREVVPRPPARAPSGGEPSPASAPPIVHETLASPGRRLDPPTRALFEPRLGLDLAGVRIHDDARAARSAEAVQAAAYTVGSDIVFAAGRYAPGTSAGDRLLAHELAHVRQHREPASLRRQEPAAPAPAKPRIDYARAKRQNEAYAKPDSLGWETKLGSIAGGAYRAWADLWAAAKHDEFADAIAEHQVLAGWSGRDVDGVLGPSTWARIAGLGEAMAGIVGVTWPKSEELCYVASTERLKRGYERATGAALELGGEEAATTFDLIISTRVDRMSDVDVAYRGTGAAGALVYAGLGTFVAEADIWTGGLRPGAAIQVWGLQASYDLLVAGEIDEDGTKRPLTEDDANFFGTSFVFVRYDTENPERMLVRHFGSSEWAERSHYEVWIAANTSEIASP